MVGIFAGLSLLRAENNCN